MFLRQQQRWQADGAILTQRNPSFAVSGKARADSSGRQMIWFVWSLYPPNSHFHSFLLSDSCFLTPAWYAFLISNCSHFPFTYLFHPSPLTLSIHISLPLSTLDNPVTSRVSNRDVHLMWKLTESQLTEEGQQDGEGLEMSGWSHRDCLCGVNVRLCKHGCVQKTKKEEPIEIAVCHEVPA